MSVDTVNEALTKVRLRIRSMPDIWGVDGAERLCGICDVLRSYLMQDDTQGFIDCAQRLLARQPDSTMEVLQQLFAEVLGNEDAVWEEFEVELRRA